MADWDTAGAGGVAFLRQRLKPVVVPDPHRLDRLVAGPDDEVYRVRQRAAAELEGLGELAEPQLRQTIRRKPSAELRRQVRALLAKLERQELPVVHLRAVRAVEVLERLATNEVRLLLWELAAGAPGGAPGP
jgi:hypothetical protein